MTRPSPSLPLLVGIPLVASLLLVFLTFPSHPRTALVGLQQRPPVVPAGGLQQSRLFWGDALKDEDEDEPKGWHDSDERLQTMANDALDLCDEVVVGGEQQEPSRVKHCVHRVVPQELTRFWHTPAGLDDWTQPTRRKDDWGEEVAGAKEHNYGRTLQKVIDQFQPHTSWDGKKIYEDGKIVGVPTYDRSSFLGYSGADRRANILFDRQAGSQVAFKGYDDDGANDDESYDVLYTERMPSQEGGGEEERTVVSSSAAPAASSRVLGLTKPEKRRSRLRQTDDPFMRYAMKFSKDSVRKARSSMSRKMKEGAASTQRLWEVMPTIYAGLPAAPSYPYPLPPAPIAPALAPGQVSVVARASPASVEPAVVVEQPWASASHLSTETNIAEEEEGDPDSYHVTVQGLPIGCDAGGVRAQWEGDLKVSEVNCGK